MATEVLDIKIRDDGTRVVTTRLRELGSAGERAGQRVQRSMKGIGEEANILSRQIFIVRRALTTLFAATGISAATRMVNEFTNMNNQLRTVTVNEEQLIQRRKELLAVSRQSLAPFRAINELYARTKRASAELGYSDKELLRFTKALAQETTLSGATTYESENAIRQLTQGMGAAGLKGEELRSVLEQLPTVAKRIADGLGVSVGALRELGAAGKITGKDVIEAMLKSADEIEASFKDVTIAPERAFEILKDQVREYVGEMDQAYGISKKLSGLMLEFASDVGGVVKDAFTFASTAALVYVGHLTKIAFTSRTATAAVTQQAAATTALANAQRTAAAAGNAQAASNVVIGSAAGSSAGRLSVFISNVSQMLGSKARLAAYALVFYQIHKEVSRLTDGAHGLPGVFRLLAHYLRQVASALSDMVFDIGKAVDKFTGLGKLLDQIPSLGQTIGQAGVEYGIRGDRKIQEQAQAFAQQQFLRSEENRRSVAASYNNEVGQNVVSAQDVTTSHLEELLKRRLPPFYSPENPYQASGPASEELKRYAKQYVDGIIAETLRESAQATGVAGPEGLVKQSLNNAFDEIQVLDRKLELEDKIRSTMAQIRDITQETASAETADTLNQQFASLDKVLTSLGDTTDIDSSRAAIEQYKVILEQLTPVLDQLDKALSLKDQTSALTEELNRTISETHAVLEEQTKKLSDEQKATALAGANETIAAATQLLEEAAARLSTSIGAAFANVLTQINAAAGAASTAAGNPSAAPPPLPEGVASQAGAGNATADITALNTELQNTINRLQTIQQQGTQSFGSLGSAGQRAGDQINNIFTNAFSSLEDALVQFVTTGKLDFKQLINAMLADLARLVIRMLIIQPLMGFFGGFFGGFGFSGGGFLGDLVSPSFGSALPGFASGGMVEDPFANLPRFAGGGRVSGPGTGVSDSVPALLSRKEFVVNAAATSRNLPALRTLNRTGDLPSGGATVNFAPNTVINVSGGQDGAKQGRNAAREFNAMIEAKFNELIRREKRSGGALSSTTQDLY